MGGLAYPYSTTEPHVHDFSGRNDSNQTACVFCGVGCELGSMSTAQGGGNGYIDRSIPIQRKRGYHWGETSAPVVE